ncbi:MAG: ATP-binding protein [Nanoarchaeota archaeon]|nr:ATP-binding protein [Nanoarchaeota archaeon]
MEERHTRLLVKQNPWWRGEKEALPEFRRDIFGKLQKYAEYRQIIAIVGLRRVGKTTLLKQLIQGMDAPKNNICYISFDDIDFQKYETAEELINYFLEFSDKSKGRFLFLDELQKLPNWDSLLKVYYDTEKNLKMFISGSSSLELKNHKETLAGRIFTFHAPILTFKEFLRYFGMESSIAEKDIARAYHLKLAVKKEKYEAKFRDYLLKGAFPELLEANDEEFIKKYIKESVIEKTITDIAKAAKEDEKVIYELLRLLANSNSQLFEIVNLANILKINRNLVSHYLTLLEKSFLIKTSYNFTASVAKQVKASKKQYSAHSCIVISLLDVPFAAIDTEIAGGMVEAVIANSIENVSFWRTPQKEEVDIVIKLRKPVPAEVKYQSLITSDDMKNLLKFCAVFKCNNAVLITKHLMEKRKIKGIEILIMPAWLFLLWEGLFQ